MFSINQRVFNTTILFSLFLSSSGNATSSFTEDWLIKNVKKNAVSAIASQHAELSGEEIELQSNAPYSYTLGGTAQLLRSNTDSSNSFQPAIRTSRGWDVYAAKAWNVGLTSQLGIKSDYSRLSSTTDIISHSPTYYLQLQASLYRNIFGKIDRSLQNQSSLAKTSVKIQGNMAEHQSIMMARTLYWSIMANAISIELSKSLVKTSKKQLLEMKRRLKSGAAEQSDVYLSDAQVSQQQASLMGLQIKEQGFLRELRKMVPGVTTISKKDFPKINIENVVASISECIVQISSHPKAPKQYSSYSQLFDVYLKTLDAEVAAAQNGLGSELTLGLEVASNGVDSTFSDAFSEASKFSKGHWGASLGLSVPLDGKQSKLINTKRRLAELNELKQRRQLELLLDGTHSTAIISIQHLLGSMRTLDSSSKALAKRVKAVSKKYKQGRIDFLSLVQEQNQLFSSEIGLTESRLLFLQEMFNYFSVYNKTPCDFNLKYAKVDF